MQIRTEMDKLTEIVEKMSNENYDKGYAEGSKQDYEEPASDCSTLMEFLNQKEKIIKMVEEI